MSYDYTDQDTERARASEHAAYQAPQPLTHVSADRQRLWAILLMIGGGVLLAGRLFFGASESIGLFGLLDGIDLRGSIFFSMVSSCFLFFGLWKRIYGLIIPGSIIGGFALAVTFAQLLGGAGFFFGMSVGFFALMFLGQMLFQQRSSWPAIPGTILLLFSMFIASMQMPMLMGGMTLLIPVAIVAAGFYLGFGRHD
ncbi:hypothetical protein F8S13_07240 [Chloroflexia bacterium SDU3-3]|nr:hypothetical protein F8S13_07240 [Chloroflexia bacterium SDU3-3]